MKSSAARALQVLLLGALVLQRCAAPKDTSPPPSPYDPPTAPLLVFLGTSLTAGYGLEPEEAYPACIQRSIDAENLHYQVVNAGVSGETSAGALRRAPWLLRQPVAVLVVETGANDGLRGQDPTATRANIQGIFDAARREHPLAKILLLGMRAPPNMGRDYTERFQVLYPELARANSAALVPFFLEGVVGIPALNQADGIHPTAEGQQMIAATVWRVLRPLL